MNRREAIRTAVIAGAMGALGYKVGSGAEAKSFEHVLKISLPQAPFANLVGWYRDEQNVYHLDYEVIFVPEELVEELMAERQTHEQWLRRRFGPFDHIEIGMESLGRKVRLEREGRVFQSIQGA